MIELMSIDRVNAKHQLRLVHLTKLCRLMQITCDRSGGIYFDTSSKPVSNAKECRENKSYSFCYPTSFRSALANRELLQRKE